MKRLVIASIRKSAGKTSVSLGLTKATAKNVAYMKPLGDRLLYRKKRLWDHDAALVTKVFGLEVSPENVSLGFEHQKLRYMYDRETTREKLLEMAEELETGKELLLVEAGAELSSGASVHLDSLTLCRWLEAKLLVVLDGDENSIMDDLYFLKNSVDTSGIPLAGVVINKLKDIEDFAVTQLPAIENLGIPVLGLLPWQPELGQLTVGYLADKLFAKIIAAEDRVERPVKHIFVGAMSASMAQKNPLFKKEDKVIITSGDRSDMILAALETGSAAIILTNSILPPPSIISRAAREGVPLLLLSSDTFLTAKHIDDMEPLVSPGDNEKIKLLAEMARSRLSLDEF